MNQNTQKAQRIKAFIFDIDGVMTDGGIIYDNDGKEYKRFNAKDGMIIKCLMQEGFIVGAITGRKSPVVSHRLNELGLDFHFHGAKDKSIHYRNIKERYSLQDEEIAYIGDDLNDLCILTKCGLSASPADGVDYVREYVDYITQRKGGQGAVREFADFILKAQGKLAAVIEKFIHQNF